MPTASDLQNLVNGGLSIAKIGETLMGAINFLLAVLPWLAIGLLVVIAINPAGWGDKIIAWMRGALVTVSNRIEANNQQLAEVKADVAAINARLDTIVEALKPKA